MKFSTEPELALGKHSKACLEVTPGSGTKIEEEEDFNVTAGSLVI